MAKRLRLGFMGTSYPCLQHAAAFEMERGAELSAVADPDDRRRKEFVRKFGAMREYADYRDMLADGGLDAAVIGLPTGMHTEASLASLDAGLHVLCEKPPSTNAKEMIWVARRAQQAGLTYMFCRQFRFTDASLQARKRVDSGRLGKVYHAESKWLRARFIPTGNRSWFTSKAGGGGVLLDLGIHSIDDAWFVMGCPRPVEALAGMHCAFSHLAPKGQEYTAEDAAVGLLRFENGATLNFTVSFSLNWPGIPPADGRRTFNPQWRETTVYGTHGGVQIINGKEGREIIGMKTGVRVRPMRGRQRVVANGAKLQFVLQARDFLRAVRENSAPTNSAEQAVMLMQMLDALRESGDTQRAVRIREAPSKSGTGGNRHRGASP